jgi:isoquinoline 1-oxidoreductase alpha subunit
MELTVNRKACEVDVPDGMPLLWVLRDVIGLTGTKFGCGVAQCGACTVLLDGQAVRSCVTPARAGGSRVVTTIEALSADGSHAVRRAWTELDVVQRGFCQPGQIMAAAALLHETPPPMPTSMPPSRATCAAAAPTSASAPPCIARPG